MRAAHYWNKDWCPASFPDTPDKKVAAAKKYGMLPEDYKPFPDNDPDSYGDYPNLPIISAESRDPYESYDFPYLRRNYGEPVNIQADIYTGQRINENTRPRTPHFQQLMTFLGVMAGALVLLVVSYKYPMPLSRQVVPMQTYRKGEVHYTFDPPE